jgi:hypothetical protein
MVTRYESRHPNSIFPVPAVLPKTVLRSPRHGGKPRDLPIRSAAKQPHPQIGDRARLWDYVKSEWIEGTIESIESDYRILVRGVDGLEETLGWCLAFRDGAWVEDPPPLSDAQ